MKRLLILLSLLGGLIVGWLPADASAADCVQTIPSQAQLKIVVNLESEGLYRLWIRQVTPASGNQMYVAVNDECAISIAKNQQNDKLSWSGADSQGQPLLFALDRGEHTIILAGDQTGIGVDKGLLTTDHDCIPQDYGDNCIVTSTAAGKVVELDQPASGADAKPANRFGVAMIFASAAGLLGVLGIILWHYVSYNKRVVFTAIEGHWLRKLKHAVSLSTVQHFFRHHQTNLMLCGILAAVFAVLLVVGIAVAEDSRALMFEAEHGEIVGSATKLADPQTSDGFYVLFGGPVPVIAGSEPTPATSAPSTGGSGGGSQNGGGGGGGSGGGGGGGTPVGECPAYPAFPDENCTGWEHTGVTLTDCTGQTDNGWIWDGEQTTFDSCYFSVPLTVQAANVTITRSQVHGYISTHWTNSYDFRNLTLRDVEIEDEGNPDAYLSAVGGHNFSCLRCNVHHTGTGIHFGDNSRVQDSYTHDFNYTEEAHGSGVAAGQGQGSNAVILHNNIQCNRLVGQPGICSSALSIYPEDNGHGGTVHNVRVEKNLFNTTGAYCVYAGGLPATNIDFIDNYFGKKYSSVCAGYGPVTAYQPEGGQWVNNIWADGSGPVIP